MMGVRGAGSCVERAFGQLSISIDALDSYAPASGAWVPLYDPAKAHVFIDINDTLGGCTKDGFTASIPGHGEAHAQFIGSSTGVDTALTATNTYGRIIVSNLTPGGFASPVATHGTCRLNFQRVLQTGRVDLEAGSITVLNARAEPM